MQKKKIKTTVKNIYKINTKIVYTINFTVYHRTA